MEFKLSHVLIASLVIILGLTLFGVVSVLTAIVLALLAVGIARNYHLSKVIKDQNAEYFNLFEVYGDEITRSNKAEKVVLELQDKLKQLTSTEVEHKESVAKTVKKVKPKKNETI